MIVRIKLEMIVMLSFLTLNAGYNYCQWLWRLWTSQPRNTIYLNGVAHSSNHPLSELFSHCVALIFPKVQILFVSLPACWVHLVSMTSSYQLKSLCSGYRSAVQHRVGMKNTIFNALLSWEHLMFGDRSRGRLRFIILWWQFCMWINAWHL